MKILIQIKITVPETTYIFIRSIQFSFYSPELPTAVQMIHLKIEFLDSNYIHSFHFTSRPQANRYKKIL